MDNLDFIYNRHSVRKFKDTAVPTEDILKLIHAATYAPSGKNVQNWHFVIVRNKEKIEGIAKVIERKNTEIAALMKDENMKNSFTKFMKYALHFRNAPVLILIYAGPYDVTAENELNDAGASPKDIHNLLRHAPAIQNIGASIENLMLAASSMGYGTCWMTSQNYASQEINDYLQFNKADYFLAAMTPLGIPHGDIKSPPRKPVEEITTIID